MHLIADEERLNDVGYGPRRWAALTDDMKLPHNMLPSDDIINFRQIDRETAQEELFQIEIDIYQLRRLYEKNSPVIRIQACYRGMIGRKNAREIYGG